MSPEESSAPTLGAVSHPKDGSNRQPLNARTTETRCHTSENHYQNIHCSGDFKSCRRTNLVYKNSMCKWITVKSRVIYAYVHRNKMQKVIRIPSCTQTCQIEVLGNHAVREKIHSFTHSWS
jgi:hypothetical protein